MSLEHFTRQADSTHCVIYGNPFGETLVSYWPSEARAQEVSKRITELGKEDGFDPRPQIESLAELDAIEAGE
jgi:hypothetical protein